MTPQEKQKKERGDYLQSVIYKYTHTSPILTDEEIIFLVCEFIEKEKGIEATNKFCKKIIKEFKNKY